MVCTIEHQKKRGYIRYFAFYHTHTPGLCSQQSHLPHGHSLCTPSSFFSFHFFFSSTFEKVGLHLGNIISFWPGRTRSWKSCHFSLARVCTGCFFYLARYWVKVTWLGTINMVFSLFSSKGYFLICSFINNAFGSILYVITY